MIYLDYSATTKVDKRVLEKFIEVESNYYANPNSSHKEGLKANGLINSSIENIKDILGIGEKEIVFTSGASESNNFVLKGIDTSKKHIITTRLEHSSIIAPIGYLQKKGYKISFVDLDKNGRVDIDNLLDLINDDTFLVSINAVNSETGIRQPIEEIGEVLKEKDLYFHSDITQCLGKDNIDLTNVDLASFSAHKIYCFKGIGGLIKNKDIKLIPLINGGKSTSIYRSGTPQTGLIAALSTAIEIMYDDLYDKKKYVRSLNDFIKLAISKYDNIVYNSNGYSIPHIVNISILGKKADDTLKFFSDHDIMISTKSACSSNNDLSLAILDLTNDEQRARSSIRISLSYKTTEDEIRKFLRVLDEYMEEV